MQHKAIAHPTDSRLMEIARTKLVEATKDPGVDLKQTFTKEGKELNRKAGRYTHARQFKRMKCATKRQRTIVGRLQREVGRKARAIGTAVRQALGETLNKAARIVAQSGQRKAVDGQRKLNSFHAPEVDYISKGKARTPYEFGVKVGIASTLQGNLIVGARAFHGSPYDGRTLKEQLEEATILLIQDSHTRPSTAFVDLGYRGVDADNPDVHIVHRGKAARGAVHSGLQHPMAAEKNRKEGGDLIAAALFAPVRDGGHITELAKHAGYFARASTPPSTPLLPAWARI